MKVFKPLQATLLHKPFEFKRKKQLSIAVLFGFPFEGNDPLLEPDLWQFISTELGKNGILDSGMPKPNGEVLIYGKYFAPNGVPAKADAVRLKMGNIDKVLLVYGNRYWRTLLGPSEPEPMRELPLDYANAFGGKGFAKNPIGKGLTDVDVFGEKRRPLPNIEHPDKVMTSSGQQPDPAGFGPLDMSWEFRTSKLGTYDDKWLAERWPAYADDLDWNYFNAAPPDQWLDGFFSGTETFSLHNMHPDKPVVRGQLPPYRTRCFIQRTVSNEERLDEINMRAETVWLFPHAETGVILYRGVIGIETDDARDVKNIIVGYENLSDEPRAANHYAMALANRLDPEHEDKYAFNTTDLIPSDAVCGYGAVTPDDAQAGGAGGGSEAEEEEDDAPFDEPEFFPRPPGYEHINELRAEKEQAEERRDEILARGGDASSVPVPVIDIGALYARLDETGREIREGYRAQAHRLVRGVPPHEAYLDAIREELFDRLQKKQKVTGWDLAGIDLSNEDLSGADLSGCYLEAVNFSGSKLIGANLEGAILAFADLTRCDLSHANLKRANLGAADLSYAVCDGAELGEAILDKSLLWGAKLTNCNMTDVELFETKMGNADLSGSTLPKAEFHELFINQAKFRKTNLAGSTFFKCILIGSDFSEAKLDKSTWIESLLDGANFSGAHMVNTRFPGGTSLREANFTRAMLDSSNLKGVDLQKAVFSEASLNKCDFGSANARQVNFTRSIAKGAKFIGTDLGEADLSSMNLMEGTLMKARLTGARLCNANCYGVEFMNATVGGTDFSGALLYKTKLEHWRPS